MKRILATVLITLLVLVAIPAVILATGAVNMGASQEAGWLERTVATWSVERSVAVRAPDKENPFAGDETAISTGERHYVAMCVRCHGGPNNERDGFAKGLNPPAPEMMRVAEEFSDGELFWITKHGIRMTGMPAFGETHKDQDLWKIVAYVKTIPEQPERPPAQSESESGRSHDANHDDHSHGSANEKSTPSGDSD